MQPRKRKTALPFFLALGKLWILRLFLMRPSGSVLFPPLSCCQSFRGTKDPEKIGKILEAASKCD